MLGLGIRRFRRSRGRPDTGVPKLVWLLPSVESAELVVDSRVDSVRTGKGGGPDGNVRSSSVICAFKSYRREEAMQILSTSSKPPGFNTRCTSYVTGRM